MGGLFKNTLILLFLASVLIGLKIHAAEDGFHPPPASHVVVER